MLYNNKGEPAFVKAGSPISTKTDVGEYIVGRKKLSARNILAQYKLIFFRRKNENL